MRRVHSTRKECRLIAGRTRRLWYMKYGYLQTQYLNRCEYVGKHWRHWYKPFLKPHPARRGISRCEWVGFSRRQGNPKVWSCAWARPRQKPRLRPRRVTVAGRPHEVEAGDGERNTTG